MNDLMNRKDTAATLLIVTIYEKQVKKLGYKGCRNCKHKISDLRTCEWDERGGDGQLHLICPHWEKKAKCK